ncbi:hypothetical protein QUC32_23090 [Novosphingobium resinovorum]|uniref:capsid assembly protein n=1 Tax=Novosphingobium TaxID=165696 RepID=UPI001B3C5712|nr:MULTISPECIES: hypothetical protein [Novosphingobium]MBF7012537.1 hypothetical protein [Novosphingobium sp. HR1a]WJM27271.1 hypothetical protein QUC32_23090 [Novosphingobium resinovorum]
MVDTVETPAAPEAPELNAAELAAVEVGQRGFSEPENVNVIPPSGPQRPEWCPEQFWKDGKADTEGLAKSYAELRSKMDSKPADTPADPAAPASPEAAPRPDGKIEKVEAPAEPVAPPAAPLTTAMDAARDEWAESGELSDESFASLEAAGLPRPIVELYLDGLKANAEKLMGEIHGYAGGTDAYNAMVQWAGQKLSAEEIEAYNTALDNPALRETAVIGLQAKYTRAVPSEGSLVIPNDGGAAASDVFRSRDELVAAQKDPRYSTDAAYRQTVVDKLARSQGGGFQAFSRPMFEQQVYSR